MSIKSLFLKNLLGTLLVIGAIPAVFSANEVIKVQFVQRPPYLSQAANGAVEGILANTTEQIFRRAGLVLQWELTSVNRQWDALLNPSEMTCAIGWYKNPEREKIGKFTKAIYQDLPQVLLARKQFSLSSTESLETLLARQNVRVLKKNKYSYGPTIDGLLKKFRTRTVISDAENQQMVKILIADRADFMFSTREEAKYLLENNDPNGELQLLNVQNMPESEKRYIVCNRLVSDELIERLNRAITF